MADIAGIRYHHLEIFFQDTTEFILPLRFIRLRGCHGDAGIGHFQRQDIEALRVRIRHHLGDPGDFNLQRVNTDIRQSDPVGKPFRQQFQRQRP